MSAFNRQRFMRIPNPYYLIVDLEATCSDDGAVPREEMEIIEIGAVMLGARNFEVESEFQAFVNPVRHPELTAFCMELTNIRQEDVAGAPLFADSLARLQAWMTAYPAALFCSRGDYDRNQFIQDCEFHQLAYPFGPGHLNLKAEFGKQFGLKKKLGITGALKHLGLEFVGSHHRGLDDANNIARIVQRVMIGG
jgi:inhibitor of KinA sporulation pathway (predicted exonuclease)